MKLQVMLDLLRIKFTPIVMKPRSLGPSTLALQDTLAYKLLMTREAELIEGNDWNDYFWGQCMGVGDNHLGKLLMQVRKELRMSLTPDASQH